MRIRAAQAGDLADLASMIAASPLLRTYGVGAAAARRMVRGALAEHDILLVAVSRSIPIGLAWVIQTRAFGRTAYLRLLLVDGSRQSRGVGAALLAVAERRAARGGARHLALLVTRTNERARRFYRHHGFRYAGGLPGFVRPQLDESIYFKPLPRR